MLSRKFVSITSHSRSQSTQWRAFARVVRTHAWMAMPSLGVRSRPSSGRRMSLRLPNPASYQWVKSERNGSTATLKRHLLKRTSFSMRPLCRPRHHISHLKHGLRWLTGRTGSAMCTAPHRAPCAATRQPPRGLESSQRTWYSSASTAVGGSVARFLGQSLRPSRDCCRGRLGNQSCCGSRAKKRTILVVLVQATKHGLGPVSVQMAV